VKQRPFLGIMGDYVYGSEWNRKELIRRPTVLNWLSTQVIDDLAARKDAAREIVRENFRYYAPCYKLKGYLVRNQCVSDTQKHLREVIHAKWKTTLMSEPNEAKSREDHEKFYEELRRLEPYLGIWYRKNGDAVFNRNGTPQETLFRPHRRIEDDVPLWDWVRESRAGLRECED
jgi:hypothetical protein